MIPTVNDPRIISIHLNVNTFWGMANLLAMLQGIGVDFIAFDMGLSNFLFFFSLHWRLKLTHTRSHPHPIPAGIQLA